MSSAKKSSGLLLRAKSSNQNYHRPDSVSDLAVFDPWVKEQLEGLYKSKGDKAHQAAAVLLNAILTKKQAVVVISTDYLNILIKEHGNLLADKEFSVREKRVSISRSSFRNLGKEMTIWAQMTGFLMKTDMIEILKPQSGKSPAVIEVIHPEWIHYLEPATDDLRLQVINSTVKIDKFKSYQEYKESCKTTKQQDDKPTKQQDYDATSPTMPTSLTRESESQVTNSVEEEIEALLEDNS